MVPVIKDDHMTHTDSRCNMIWRWWWPVWLSKIHAEAICQSFILLLCCYTWENVHILPELTTKPCLPKCTILTKIWRPTHSKRIRLAQTVHQWLFFLSFFLFFFFFESTMSMLLQHKLSALWKLSSSSSSYALKDSHTYTHTHTHTHTHKVKKTTLNKKEKENKQ